MSLFIKIIDVHAREILDSRGNPTVEVEVTAETETTGKKITARESVPSGASTGRFEAIELRDGEERYFGLGVRKVVDHVNQKIREKLIGFNVLDQAGIDRIMVEEDGTDNKGNLGANAILGVSMACAKTAAKALEQPLYRYLGGMMAHILPVPMMNVINGGVHAKNSIDFQEFMIMPVGALDLHDGLRMGAEIYHFLRQILNEEGLSTAVGDEGGFAPDVKDTREVFRYLQKAVEKAGYHVGDDVVFAMDAAASELYDEETGLYIFPGESRAAGKEPEEGAGEGSAKDYCKDSVKRSADEMKEAACVVCRAARIRKDAGIMMKMALKDMLTEGSAEMCFELGEYFHERGDDSEASLWYYNAMHEAPSILNIHMSTDWPEKRLAEVEK